MDSFNEHPRGALHAYLDEELSLEGSLAVEEHLAGCGACRRELETLRALRRLLQSAKAPAPEAEAALTRVTGSVRARRRRVLAVGGIAAMAAAALVTLVVVSGRTGGIVREVAAVHARALDSGSAVEIASDDPGRHRALALGAAARVGATGGRGRRVRAARRSPRLARRPPGGGGGVPGAKPPGGRVRLALDRGRQRAAAVGDRSMDRLPLVPSRRGVLDGLGRGPGRSQGARRADQGTPHVRGHRRAGALGAGVIGAVGLALGAVALGAVDPSATTRPSRLERAVARAVLDAAVRARAPRGRTAPMDAASLERGREAYRAHCLVCHGVPGGAQSSIAAGLNPSVPDLGEPETQGRTDGELYFLVSGGVRLTGMPGFEQSLPEAVRWDVVAFLRALPRLGDGERKALSTR